ncbi:unnamed protein product [Rhizophagus irregularis]|nr:unnamed protein product [Rhizophagus irregularis]
MLGYRTRTWKNLVLDSHFNLISALDKYRFDSLALDVSFDSLAFDIGFNSLDLDVGYGSYALDRYRFRWIG